MTTAAELVQAGFSDDEVNAHSLKQNKELLGAGFSQQEISNHTGIPNDQYLQVLSNSNKRELQTVTTFLDSGYSPYIEVGGKKGRFNFNVEGKISNLTPGVQYQFETVDGSSYNYQLENDYQGGNWQDAGHAQENFENYKKWPKHTRDEIFKQMWAGNEEVSDFISKAVDENLPWETVKEGLNQFHTYRQISITDLKPADANMSEEDMDKMMETLITGANRNLADFPTMEIGGEVSDAERKNFELINKMIKEQGSNPALMNKNLSIPELTELAYDSSVVGLINNLGQLELGGDDARQQVANFFLMSQAYQGLDFSKQLYFDVAAVTAELPIMIPAGMAGASACSWMIGGGAATAAVPGAIAGTLFTTGCAMGAAFGVPGFLRTALTDLMQARVTNNEVEGLMVLKHALKEGGKEFLIGMLTGNARVLTQYGMKTLGVTGETIAQRTLMGAGTLVAETTTMTAAGAYIHGYSPGWEDFTKTAAVLLVLRGGNKGAKSFKDSVSGKVRTTEWYIQRNLATMYKEMGVDPRRVKADMEENPELARELAEILGRETYVPPKFYFDQFTSIMKRIEQVSRSEVVVGGENVKVSRFIDIKEGSPTTLEVMGKNSLPGRKATKITFEMTEKGNWVIKDFEGRLDKNQIVAIADFAESKGRKIELSEDFTEVVKIIEARESKTKPLDEVDIQLHEMIQEAKLSESVLRETGQDALADKVVKDSEALLKATFGKEYIETNKAKIEEFQKDQEKVVEEIAERDQFIKTGFHFANTVIKQQGGDDALGRIDKLEIPKFDNDTGELIVSHATESINATKIGDTGFDKESGNGFIVFSSDVQSSSKADTMTNPKLVRVHVRYEKPLDMRSYFKAEEAGKLQLAGEDFYSASKLENGKDIANYFFNVLRIVDKNHPARWTQEEFDRVQNEPDNRAKTQKAAEIMVEKGYDSIIFKDAQGQDAIAILKAENAKVLGFKEVVKAEPKVEPKVEPTEKSSALETFAKEFKTAEEFIEGLHNRDFEYVKGKDVDKLGLVKTQLARNPIEKQFSLFELYSKEFDQALKELGVVWSSREKSWIRSPENAKQYFDEHFAKVKDSSKENPKVTKVSEENLRTIFEESKVEPEEYNQAQKENINKKQAEPEWTEKPSKESKESEQETQFNMDVIDESPQAKKIMSLPALVELARQLLDGKLPTIHKNLGLGTQGLMSAKKGVAGSAKIKLRADIAKDYAAAVRVLAHEIGHVADWLQGQKDYTLSRGNVLGRIASLHKYLSNYLEGRPGGQKPLTEKEKQKLRREAKKIIENTIETLSKDKKLQEETGMTPQNIKDMHTGVLNKGEVDPRIWKWYQKADGKLKKEILRAATRGEVWAEIKALEKQDKASPTPDLKGRIKEKYEEILAAEIESRGLLSRDIVSEELKKLTQIWRPYDPEANPNYTKYRNDPAELYADFMSAILTNPAFARQVAPTAYEGFFNWLSTKPKFQKVYDEIQEDLSSGQVIPKAVKRLRDGFDEAEKKFLEELESDKLSEHALDHIMRGVVDRYHDLIKAVSKRKGEVSDKENPVYKVEEFTYQGSESEGYMSSIAHRMIKVMEKNGIKANDVGEYLFHKRIVEEKGGKERGEIFNPLGFDKVASAERMAEMEKNAPRLPELADAFWKIRQEWLVDRLDSTGMYPADLMQKIRDNDSYVKFDVIEYFDTHYGSGAGAKIFGQVGTLKEIANPFTRTLVNDMVLMKAASRHIAMNSVIEFYRNTSLADPSVPFAKATKKWKNGNWEFEQPVSKDLGLMTVLREGKIEGYYLDKHVVKSFERSNLDSVWAIRAMRAANTPFRKVFTELNYGFWAFNIWRDYMRTIRNLPSVGSEKIIPYKKFVTFLNTYRKGIVPAFKSVYGIHDSTVKEMLKNNELISIEERWGDQKYDTEQERLLKRHHQIPHKYDNEYTKPIQAFFRHWHNIGQGLERVPKVAAHIYLKENFPNMTAERRGHMIRVQAGSPAFLRQGTWTSATNNIFMFSNAMKEGWRGDMEVLKERPTEFMYNVFQYNIVPKLLMLGLAKGMFGDENMTIMNAISEYDKANYIIIPLGLTEKGKAVYMRIPQDETGRFFGGVFWKSMNEESELPDFLNYGGGQIPSMSPYIDLFKKLGQYTTGEVPYDPFRNTAAINQTKWDANGSYRRNAFLGHLWDSSGGKIVMSARGRFSSDLETIKTEAEEFLSVPGVENLIGRFIKISDFGVRESIDPKDARQKSAEQSLLANQYLQRFIKDNNYKPSNEEINALAAKEKSLNVRVKKLMLSNHGNAFLQELINAPSDLARVEIFRKIKELADDGNITAKELLGYTNKQ